METQRLLAGWMDTQGLLVGVVDMQEVRIDRHLLMMATAPHSGWMYPLSESARFRMV